MTLTLHLPADPAMLVSANQRIHHHQRAKIVRHWRELARNAVPGEWLQVDRAHVTCWFTFPTKRRRDVGNLYPYVAKSIVDGLVEAELLVDDDDTRLVGPDMRRDPVNGPHALRVVIEPL